MLAQHEIAYLNICNWFHPRYLKLVEKLDKLNLVIVHEGKEFQIKTWGLYHSLIDELKPGWKKSPSGGHCNFKGLLESIFKFV